MKYILIIPLVFLQLLSYSQENKSKISSKTDKKIYQIGETIKIELKAKKSFRLMTDGGCSSSVLSPSFIKEVNGEWQETEVQAQMCCGLPYSLPIKKVNYEMVREVAGRYKIVVFIDGGMIFSNVFEVKDD